MNKTRSQLSMAVKMYSMSKIMSSHYFRCLNLRVIENERFFANVERTETNK